MPHPSPNSRSQSSHDLAHSAWIWSHTHRVLDQVGLAEVRGYRLRQLEAEESARMAQLESQRTLLPGLEALTILSIESA